MKLFPSVFLFALLSLNPIAGHADTTDKHSEIQYSLDKDGRKWKVGYEAKNENQSIKEYVLDNENVDNWTELFTVHSYNGITLSVDKYYDAFIAELKKMAPNSKVESRIISKDPNSLFGEWWISDNTPDAQHEWFRIFTDGKDVVVLRYTTKRNSDVESARKNWEEILGQAKFEPKAEETKTETKTEPKVEEIKTEQPKIDTESKIESEPKVEEKEIESNTEESKEPAAPVGQ